MSNTYFYLRISTRENQDKQSFLRQEKSLKAYAENNNLNYNHRTIYKDDTTGSTFNRTEWQSLENILQSGDTIVFKEISRFTREAELGYSKYMELMSKGINLVFIDNPTISTDYIKRLIKVAKGQDLIVKTVLDSTIELLLIVELDRVQQERETIVKRIKQGIEASDKKSGRPIGKLDKMTDSLRADIQEYFLNRTIKLVDLMNKHNISRNTLKKYIDIVKKEN